MPQIDKETLEDVARLLDDCERQFRRQADGEKAKLDQISSLVERETCVSDAVRYDTLADACQKYGGLILLEIFESAEGR